MARDAVKLVQLKIVIAVAERGSLRAASRDLGITQPALTRSIQDLERELGEPLFVRQGGGMALTDVGRSVLRHAVGIESEIERLRDGIAQLKGVRGGTATIGLSTVAHIGLLPRVLGPFRRRYPEVRINIVEGVFPAVEDALESGAVDFYVGPVPGALRPATFAVEPLFSNRRVIVCGVDNPLAGAESLKDLVGASWVTNSLTPVSEDELAPVFRRHGLPPPRVAVNGQTFLTMVMSVANSDLLAMLPQQWLEVLRASLLLLQVRVREELPTVATICIVRRAAMPLPPATEHLSDLFRRAAIHHAATLPGNPVIAS